MNASRTRRSVRACRRPAAMESVEPRAHFAINAASLSYSALAAPAGAGAFPTWLSGSGDTQGRAVVVAIRLGSNDSPQIGGVITDGNGDTRTFVVPGAGGANGVEGPEVAMLTGGNFVVSWTQPGTTRDVLVRRFNATGVAQGTGATRVTASAAGDQLESSVAAYPDGSFVVAFRSSTAASTGGIYLRRFDPNGQPAGSAETRVDTVDTGNSGDPRVAVGPNGETAVVWYNSTAGGVYLKRYAPDGTAVATSEVPVGDGNAPWVAYTDRGLPFIVWRGSTGSDVFARVMQPDGTLGARFTVDVSSDTVQGVTGGTLTGPTVQATANGYVLVSWSQGRRANSAADGADVNVRAYRSDGTPAQFQGSLGVTTVFNSGVGTEHLGSRLLTVGPSQLYMVTAKNSFFDLGGTISTTASLTGRGFTATAATALAGGPYQIAEAAPLTLAGSGTDAENNPLAFGWDVNGDGVFGDATGPNPTLTTAQLAALGIADGPAVFNVRVRVEDAFGDTATSAPATLTVANAPPTAAGLSGPAGVDEGQGATISIPGATDVSPADLAAGFSYSFDFDNDGTFEVTDSATPAVPIPAAFLADGPTVRTIRGRVTDRDGGFTDYILDLPIGNAAPTADFTTPVGPSAGSPITVIGSATDPADADLAAGFTFLWSVGKDGQVIEQGQGPTYTFTPGTSGTYSVTLVARDKDGGQSPTAIRSFTVAAPGNGGGQSDGFGPAATLVPVSTPPAATSPFLDLSVVYADPNGVDPATVVDGNIVVDTPDGLALSVPLRSRTVANGQVVATYRLALPGGGFSPGTYAVRLLASVVRDLAGNSAPAATLGTFAVTGAPTPPPRVGGVDTSFGGGAGRVDSFVPVTNVRILDSFPLPGGASVAAGLDAAARLVLFRFNPDGTTDTSYGESGTGFRAFELPTGFTAQNLSFNPAGQILALGTAGDDARPALLRLTGDGALDSGFGGGQPVPIAAFTGADVVTAAVEARGRIVVAGAHAGGTQLAVARLNLNGSLDPSFGTNRGQYLRPGRPGDLLTSVAVSPSGDITAGGTLNGRAIVIRLTAKGRPAPGFTAQPVNLAGNGYASADEIVAQPDGRVLLLASTAASGAAADQGDFGVAVARLTAKGALDPTFNDTGVLVVQPNPAPSAPAAPSDVLQPLIDMANATLRATQGGGILYLATNGPNDTTQVTVFAIRTSGIDVSATLQVSTKTANAGKKAAATVLVRNTGDTVANGRLKVTLAFSPTQAPADAIFHSAALVAIKRLAVGPKIRTFKLSFAVPAAAGSYTLFATIAPEGFADLDPSNNAATEPATAGTITVTGARK